MLLLYIIYTCYYVKIISDSGMTQEEYEAISRSQTIYQSQRAKLLELKFDGDVAKYDRYVEKCKGEYSFDFNTKDK